MNKRRFPEVGSTPIQNNRAVRPFGGADWPCRLRATGLKVTGCSGAGKSLTVDARLSGGQRLVFKLYKTRRGYLVCDVNVASVWLAQQMGSNFIAVIRRGGGDIDALFAYLRR